ncbi:Glutathione transport system permease protein GsiC [Neomoorella glycerini]|uniref:Nickel import system permease protein NikB n=1 Tax=Neomoorella glycerini TaxID=55779 RepID=A0A6I5ZW04_9FIRM|nr:nickel ABC transporter permease [Moorella glycerini]QGP93849.1 Glutathione transport system permease protein GsiC [Moorella glycerini]
MYILRRLGAGIPTLLGITLIAFLLGVIAPGDPAAEVLRLGGMTEPTQEEIQAMRQQMGLDKPLPVQYMNWVGRALQGDLGTSYMTGRPVAGELLSRLPATALLALAAVTFAVLFGIPLGVLMAIKSDTFMDHLGRAGALTLTSMPGFWLAILLIGLTAERLHLLPTSGFGTWQHLLLPAIVLGAGTSATLMRLTRATLLDVLGQDYIRAARAKGLSSGVVVLRHALPNAFIPLLTVIGLNLGHILGGSVVVEVIFAWPGIGRLAVDAIFRRDYPVIQGYVVFTGLVFLSLNLIVDLLYRLLNPQVRLGESAE